MSLQNYSLEEAASVLRCYPRYLQDNLSRLPHQKIGGAVVFDESELLAIKDIHRRRPQSTDEGDASGTGTRPPVALAAIKPSRGRRRTA
ncbi:hypothetical protein [Streptomyces sp. NPDC092952]|uniref:hypothetical protein n=1 Tax=Streptomyces sp. NPDC092952 TaxID=3366018 RepID=UPI00380FF30C